MKRKYILLILFLSFGLLGCSSEYTVNLYNDDETIYETYSGVKNNSVIELPVLEEEGLIFVGWSDGELIYNNNLRIRQDLELSAVFEVASEVFEYNINIEDNEAYITNYTGDAKYLKIPVRIEGMVVKTIQSHAFENSELVELEIPKSLISISPQAFKGSNDLEKISFYGEYFGEKDLALNHYQYDEILDDYGEACTVTEDNEDSWIFSEGCPIKSVNDYETMEINQMEVTTYYVTVDLRYYEGGFSMFIIHGSAFKDMESLTTIEFPERYNIFHPSIFDNTPRLVNISFADNENYQVIDSVIYNAEKDAIIYYPTGLEFDHFDIPDFVTEIRSTAFYDNHYLKSIFIHETVDSIASSAFHNTHLLQAIQVDSKNVYFHSIDGVLYTYNHTLIAYPSAKTDIEFIMPDTIREVAINAFYGQKFLESITLSSNLEFLGNQAFMYVEKLKVLNIPSSVTFIGHSLTRRSSIETIIINRSYVEDGSLPGPIQQAYPDYPDIYVPDDSLSHYSSDFNWQPVGQYLHPISELDTEE